MSLNVWALDCRVGVCGSLAHGTGHRASRIHPVKTVLYLKDADEALAGVIQPLGAWALALVPYSTYVLVRVKASLFSSCLRCQLSTV